MTKLKDIAFEVLSDFQDRDFRNENNRIEVAAVIEERYRNFMKQFATQYLEKKAIEQLENRINSGIITGPGNFDPSQRKR